MLESMRMVRKGHFKMEFAAKNIKMYAPEYLQGPWLRGIEACKDFTGNEYLCSSFSVLFTISNNVF